jgi:aspartate aminotransferase
MAPTWAMRDAFLKRRDLVISLLDAIPGMKANRPEGAFYVFPDISAYFGKSFGDITIKDANDFCDYLMTSAHVATVSGAAFGADNCFRLSYAASEEELRTAIARIADAVAKLK